MKIRKKVWENKSNGQKAVTIPKYCEIEAGDEVLIEKVPKKKESIKNTNTDTLRLKETKEGI